MKAPVVNEKKKSVRRRSQKGGFPPGSVVYIGTRDAHPAKIEVIDYSAETFEQRVVSQTGGLKPTPDSKSMRWINVVGLNDVAMIESLGKEFGIHPLILEDIANTDQRPKLEEEENYIYLTMKMLQQPKPTDAVKIEQTTLLFGQNWLILFQEDEGDLFDPIRERLKSHKGKLSSLTPDLLAYSMMDAIVDHYFLLIENKLEIVEDLEARVMSDTVSDTPVMIYNLQRSMLILRRAIWPLREVIAHFLRIESPLVCHATRSYLRDVYDHSIQIIDTIENMRDVLSSMVEVHYSNVSIRTNDVMKILTIIATIFMPLTFISSIYGMNFKHMPELDWEFGYPFALVLMISVTVGMLFWFRKKKWL